MDLIPQVLEYKGHIVRLAKDCISLLDSLTHLLKGSVLDKYTYKHGKKQSREFSITTDLLYLQWKPENSSRKIRKYLLSDILDISSGNSEFACRNHHEIKQDSENLCFTIILKERPVNIVAPSPKIRDLWVNGLKTLIKPEKPNYSEDLSNFDSMFNISLSKLKQELSNPEKSVLQSNESLQIEDSENIKLKKRMKDLEKANSKLQKELSDMNFIVNKEEKAEGVLKKEIKSKEKSEKKMQSQIELLNLQFENLEKEYTQKILLFEEKMNQKDSKLLEVQAEFEEFKKQIKESFNKSLVQKVQQYRESKEILCSYVNYLKDRLETIEKEVALWQTVVHTHVLPIYQSKKTGKMPGFKQVLEFALDNMERKLLTDRSQTQFISLLTEARKNVKP